MTRTDFGDIVVFDQQEACPYLDGQVARMPMQMPIGRVSPWQTDWRLAAGLRRTGEFVYQVKCPSCAACQPTRVLCNEYQFSKNANRVISKNDRLLRQQMSKPVCDDRRVELFNLHRKSRGLSVKDSDIDSEGYEWGFVRTCMESIEISYWDDERLVCVALCDLGKTAISAVYTFYDPDCGIKSIGTYSILKQIQFCQGHDLDHLYLGYYIEQSPHMNYKSRFAPQERLIDGDWLRFEKQNRSSSGN
jgi:arginine-tRNA-protein transferase